MTKAAGSNRDNFSAAVRQALAKRVAYRCSLCDMQTVGPKAGTSKPYDIGKAAHIAAAAPGGPRYDEKQTPELRSSFENGIWCCANCADKIDRNDSPYSVAQLLKKKAEAEAKSESRVGTPQVSDVASTLKGIDRAITRFCVDEEERLEALDPRFEASVRHTGNGTVSTLTAMRDSVPISIKLSRSAPKGALESIRDVFNFGGAESFNDITVEFEGSPLFDELSGVLKRFEISMATEPLTMSASFGADEDTALHIDFVGSVGGGAKGWRFRGHAFDGLLSLVVTNDRASGTNHFVLDFAFQEWGGKPIMKLPHFARMYQLALELSKGTEVGLRASIKGTEANVGGGKLAPELFLSQNRALLQQVATLRRLDGFYGLEMVMPNIAFDALRYDEDVSVALAVIDIQEDEAAEVSQNFVITGPADNLRRILEDQKPVPVELQKIVSFELLGTACGPYLVGISCESALLTPVGEVILDTGASVQISMRGANGSRWKSQILPS